jgi:hypothetical protein
VEWNVTSELRIMVPGAESPEDYIDSEAERPQEVDAKSDNLDLQPQEYRSLVRLPGILPGEHPKRSYSKKPHPRPVDKEPGKIEA